MPASPSFPEPRSVRVYILRLRREPDGALAGQITDPSTMRRWAFRGFEELRQLLETMEPETPPDPTA